MRSTSKLNRRYAAPGECAAVVQMWDEGYTAGEIADRLHRSVRTVWTWLNNAGRFSDDRGRKPKEKPPDNVRADIMAPIGKSERFAEMDKSIRQMRAACGLDPRTGKPIAGARRCSLIEAGYQSSMAGGMWDGMS